LFYDLADHAFFLVINPTLIATIAGGRKDNSHFSTFSKLTMKFNVFFHLFWLDSYFFEVKKKEKNEISHV